jgi:hypothetical protein
MLQSTFGLVLKVSRRITDPRRAWSVATQVPARVWRKLADLARARRERYWLRQAGFIHYTARGSLAEPVAVPGDPLTPRGRRAAERVVEAYRRASDVARANAPSQWDFARDSFFGPFVSALESRDVDTVHRILANMFREGVVWGTARMHPSWPAEFARRPRDHYLPLRATDMLCSLGEAVGVRAAPSIEQACDFERYATGFRIDLAGLVSDIEEAANLDLSFPQMLGAIGVRVADRFFTLDSLIHSYSLFRLRELGATANSSFVEIGGGYGCMGLLFARAGLGDYTIVDLPFMNAVQGYFLLNTLPEEEVRLFGEDAPSDRPVTRVAPHWAFHDLADRSVDYVINVNSLPEIGRAEAADYLRTIGRVTREMFVSLNQEAGSVVPGIGRQGRVADLAEDTGTLQRVARWRWWMEQGYVEEHYRPVE